MAHDFKSIGLQDPIIVRLPEVKTALAENGAGKVETTVGRLLFNEALPDDFPYINETLQSRELTSLVSRVADRYDQTETAEVLNKLKTLGFFWASRAGVTVSIQDVLKPPRKQQILDEFEKRAEKVESQFRRGIITDDERRQELIEIWTEATERVREDMEDRFRQEPFNPIYMMATSGARGNMTQVRQIAGMRGLVANPKGDIIPRPIKANFREGLSVLEYFISTHGARKGLADTALRTADSGYLTRRLVDVTQDVIVRESDCGTERGIPVTVATQRPIPGKKGEFEWVRPRAVESQALSRILAEDIMDPAGGRHRDRRRGDRPAGRARHRRGAVPLGADLRLQGRGVPAVLRPQPGQQPAGRHRRGGRHHRRPVDRRARHPADHADLPHRRHRR
jgi:DNA-directed RNA polymerase subunit beta'